MNRILLAAATAALSIPAAAQDLPKPSPKGEVEQVVGLTNISVEYSRPNVRGRQIFGGLLPFDKLWRLGANENTTIEVDGPVLIDGQKLAKGKYSMFAIPGKEAWTIIFNKNTKLWGESDYKESEDALRVKVKPEGCAFTENLTFDFASVKDDKAELEISWEKTMVKVPIAADATQQALENIKKAMAEKDVKAGTYGSSARFVLDRGLMTKEALGWAEKAVKMEPKYYNIYTLALAQGANGLYKDAVATAKKGIEAAKKAGSDAYVKLNEEKIKEWSAKMK